MGFAIAAGIGAAVSAYGSYASSNAAGGAARAQQDAAERFNKYTQGTTQKAMDLVSNPTDIAAYDKALAAQTNVVNKQQELANSLSPNLIEIGKQLHGLLQGQSAPVLDNLNKQRALQRQQLVDRMNAQMGPGGQSSSAGIQALNQFDNETSNILNQAQDQHIQEFMGASLSSPQVLNALGGANKDLAEMESMSPGQRQANILMGMSGANADAQHQVIGAAGADQVAAQMQGQGIANMGNTLMVAGAAGYGNRYMKAAGTVAPGTTAPGGAPGNTLGGDLGGSYMGANAANDGTMQTPRGGYGSSGGMGVPRASSAIATTGANYGPMATGYRGNAYMQSPGPYASGYNTQNSRLVGENE